MTSKKFLIWWNNTFPFDRAYRKKYNVAFGSPEHLALCPIDIKLDILEDKLYEEHYADLALKKAEAEMLELGMILKPRVSQSEIDLFDNLVF